MSIHTRPNTPIENQQPRRIALPTAHAYVAKSRRDQTHADAVAAFCAMKGVDIVESGSDDQVVDLLEDWDPVLRERLRVASNPRFTSIPLMMPSSRFSAIWRMTGALAPTSTTSTSRARRSK
jgi:hypothetical protein